MLERITGAEMLGLLQRRPWRMQTLGRGLAEAHLAIHGDRLSVIDWPNAARGVPEADHARAILLLRWADPLPGTPLVIRGLVAAGRSLLARTYVRAYAHGSPRPPQQVESWLFASKVPCSRRRGRCVR
ncbi:hypothetical protein [Promicromonospora panici]|uniref:hypothetical protein n=1 Tax=Promicromonospora panici TaxID=2219658 RepID=UPI00101C5C77|nr:hypothetical protein [Promicromonospora panici]